VGKSFKDAISVTGSEQTRDRRFRGGKANTRSIRRGGCLYPASFSRVLEAGDPIWQNGGTPQAVFVYGDSRRQLSLNATHLQSDRRVDDKIDALPVDRWQRKMFANVLFHGQFLSEPSVDETRPRLVLPGKQALRNKI